MTTHSSKKRKRTNTPDGGSDDSSRPDRFAPPPPKPRTAAPVTAVQTTPPRAKSLYRKVPSKIGRCHGGQRCCVACGGGDDGGEIGGHTEPRARCLACDGEYHPGCLDPPRLYAPKEGWVCGVCSGNSHHDRKWFPLPVGAKQGATTTALGSPAPRKQKGTQQQQQQQKGAAAPQSRFVDVVSSALARLSSLSDGGSGGSGETATVEERAPGVVGPVAAAAAAAVAEAVAEAVAAAATSQAASPSAGRSREKEDAARVTDSVLAWALKSVGGSGEEGKTKQSQSADGSKDGGSGPDVYLDGTEGRDSPESRPLSPAAEKRGDRRRRGGLTRSESEGSFESVGGSGNGNGEGDGDEFTPEFWEEKAEAQEDLVMSDARDNDGGGDDGMYDFGDSDGEDLAWMEDADGSGAESEASAKSRQGRRSSCSDSDGSFSTRAAESKAGVAASDRAPAHNGGGGGGGGTFAVTNGDTESSAAVVALGSESEEGGEEKQKKKKRGFWDKDANTRFLQGVTKYGDAWARLAQRHQERGVVVVDESDSSDDNDDDEGEADDDFGGGESCEDGELLYASAPEGGEEADEKLQKKKQQNKDKKKKKGEIKKVGLGPTQRNKELRWDEGEHQRFIEGFEKHGGSWAEVASVVSTRNVEQVSRYALRWVDDDGRVRGKTHVKKTGLWDKDEHERFVEGINKFGRCFQDIAIVVGTRDRVQVKKHAHANQVKKLDVGGNLDKLECVKHGPWGKQEHERFLEAIAKHGRSWMAVARAVGTREFMQVQNHAKAVLNKDLSPKIAAPTPASRAKRSDSASAGNAIPPRAAAAAAAAAAAPPAPASPTSARSAPTRKTARPPRRQAPAAAAAKPNPRAAAVATPAEQGGRGGRGANAAGAGGPPVNTDNDPSSVAVVENESGHEDDEGYGGDSGSCGDANKTRAKPETKAKESENGKNPGSRQIHQDLQWGEVEHQRFAKGFKKHGSSWAEVARAVRTRNEDQVSRYALRWVDDDGRVRSKTSVNYTGQWYEDEHARFIEGVRKFGRSFRDIAIVVGTRSADQVSKHARAQGVKEKVFQNSKPMKKLWDKEEHERLLEAVAKHGRKWAAVAEAVRTRDKAQVYRRVVSCLNRDLSPKTAAPAPASPAKRRGVGGTSAAEAPGGENEASSAADEAEINNESGAADADARKEEGGREERVASRTRARLPGDAEDRRRQKKARKGKKKKKK